MDKNVPCNATRKFTRITRMELIFNARQPSRCPELPAGHGNYAYWQKSTASSSEQRRNPCLQDGKALECLQARPDPVYEPMSVSLIFRLGQKESRWTPQPESSGIRFYRIQTIRDSISLDADAGEQRRFSANRDFFVTFGHCIKGHTPRLSR